MKKIIALICIATLIGVDKYLFSQENFCKQMSLQEAVLPSPLADSLRSDTINILKTTINLQITDFAGKTISGNTKVDFVPKVNSISTLSLDLLKLIVDSIEINNTISTTKNDIFVTQFRHDQMPDEATVHKYIKSRLRS